MQQYACPFHRRVVIRGIDVDVSESRLETSRLLERDDRGDKEVVEIDVHQPLVKVTFLLVGVLPSPQFLQCQWICGHNVLVPAVPWPRAGSLTLSGCKDNVLLEGVPLHRTYGF